MCLKCQDLFHTHKYLPVQNGTGPWKKEKINHLDIWLTFLAEYLYTAHCCIVHCQGRKIQLNCIQEVLDMLKIVEAHPSLHIHFEAHEFRHPKMKWKTQRDLLILCNYLHSQANLCCFIKLKANNYKDMLNAKNSLCIGYYF